MNDPPLIISQIEKRCIQTRLRLAPSSNALIEELSFWSKNVYNSSLFAYGKHMKLHDLQVSFYCTRFYEFIDQFSPSDRIVIAKKLSFLKEHEKLNSLIRSSHKNEIELRKYVTEESIIQENKNKEETSFVDLKYILDFFSKHNAELSRMVTDNPTNEIESKQLLRFIIDFQAALANKINRSRQKNKDSEIKVIENPDTISKPVFKPSIIMPMTPDGTFIEHYCSLNCESYEKMPSQCGQQTVKKAMLAYSSYFALLSSEKMTGKRVRPPSYLKKDGKYSVIFQNKSFLEGVRPGKIRLSMGKVMKPKLKVSLKDLPQRSMCQNIRVKKSNINDGFLYIDFPPPLNGRKINEIEVIPKHHGRWFKVKYSYDLQSNMKKVTIDQKSKKKTPTVCPDSNNICEYASIDLGVINLATVYIPSDKDRPLIIKGRELVRENNIARTRLAKLSKKHGKYTNKHYLVLRQRENRISNFLHTASRKIIDHLKSRGVKQLVIGYNTNWKSRVNLGAKNNDMFYKIPFRNLIDQLFYKGEDAGIKVIETNESYTSKCDALNDENVCFHETYSGSRYKRGLFKSAIGAVINADVNGAINILRKFVLRLGSTVIEELRNIIKKTHQLIKSPMRSGIINKTISKANGMWMNCIAQCVVSRGRDTPD